MNGHQSACGDLHRLMGRGLSPVQVGSPRSVRFGAEGFRPGNAQAFCLGDSL